MIQIEDKTKCCGCTACAEICPHQCIAMKPDSEGFLYPVVDVGRCVRCNLCDSVCPVSHPFTPQPPQKIYAAWHTDESIRLNSSSGGVFTALAEMVVRNNGMVFGARFDEKWSVVHDFAETRDDLTAFRGSKYVQSVIGNSYYEASRFLYAGRQVLFSGTPCQVAGLKRFLRRDYDNLLTVVVICHGVSSPLVWKSYLKPYLPVAAISCRDKRAGWHRYGLALKYRFWTRFETHRHNAFLRGYLQNLYLRPVCHHCPFREFKSGGDVTLGDLWGVSSILCNDDKGMSLVLMKKCDGKFEHVDHMEKMELKGDEIQKALDGNPSLFYNECPHPKRGMFFGAMAKGSMSFRAVDKDCSSLSRHEIIRLAVESRLAQLGLLQKAVDMKNAVGRLKGYFS